MATVIKQNGYERAPKPIYGNEEEMEKPVEFDQFLSLLAKYLAPYLSKEFQQNPKSACKKCGSTQTKKTEGKGPHSGKLECSECGQFIRWLGKSEK